MGYVTECFAKRLKEIREAAGFSQVQLASALEVSRGAISYYEKGERTPDIEFLDKLAAYFCLPLDFVMGYTKNSNIEYRDMYENYGLTDSACSHLEQDQELGHLISAALGHKDFVKLSLLYHRFLDNYKSFDNSQLAYFSFLMSDSLNKIIFDSLDTLSEFQFSYDRRSALAANHNYTIEELEKISLDPAEYDKLFKELPEFEEDEELSPDELVRLEAIKKIRDVIFESSEFCGNSLLRSRSQN